MQHTTDQQVTQIPNHQEQEAYKIEYLNLSFVESMKSLTLHKMP